MSISASVYQCTDSRWITWLDTAFCFILLMKEGIVNQWLVWDLTTRRQKAVQKEHTLNNLYCFLLLPTGFTSVWFNEEASIPLKQAQQCLVLLLSLTLYCSLPTNQLLTSLASFSLAHRRTSEYTHAGPWSSCDFLIMRELSHRISVCAAVWPGGQQVGQKQLLVTDFLWTRRRGGVWEPIASGKWKSYGGGPAAVSSRTGGQMVEKEPSNTSSPPYFSDK